jgi:hypothetical protein
MRQQEYPEKRQYHSWATDDHHTWVSVVATGLARIGDIPFRWLKLLLLATLFLRGQRYGSEV